MIQEELIQVEIIALVEEETSQSPIVVLYDKSTNRVLPIWIGDPEARAIAVALNNIDTPRPLTHQLLLNVIQKLGLVIEKIAVDRIERHTYYATLYLKKDSEIIKIDARPSDSIAIALAAKVPIFVAAEVMKKASQGNPFPAMKMGDYEKQRTARKIEFTKEDLGRISDVLKKAREREEKSTGI